MSFYHSNLNSEAGLSAEPRSFRGRLSVHIFLDIKERLFVIGTATLSEGGIGTSSALCSTLHGHELSFSDESVQVVIGSTTIDKNFTTVLSLYIFFTNDGVLTMLCDMLISCFYVWNTGAMRLIDRSGSPASVFSPVAHAMDVDQVGEKKR